MPFCLAISPKDHLYVGVPGWKGGDIALYPPCSMFGPCFWFFFFFFDVFVKILDQLTKIMFKSGKYFSRLVYIYRRQSVLCDFESKVKHSSARLPVSNFRKSTIRLRHHVCRRRGNHEILNKCYSTYTGHYDYEETCKDASNSSICGGYYLRLAAAS